MFLDLPGFGSEWQSKSPMNVDDITDQVREKWLKERKDGPYILISISFGGMVGINWGSRFPDDLKGLVVMNSSLPKISSKLDRITLMGFLELIKMFSAPDFEIREELILKLTTNKPDNVNEYLKKFTIYQLEMTADKKNISRQTIAARNMNVPKELKPKLLCLTSEADRMVNYKCSEDIANEYNGQLRVHSFAGHDLTMDEPYWVADQIEDWLKQNY